MPTLKDLSDKVDALQIALDDEQTAIQNAINTLQETVTTLEGQIVAGGTESDRQVVLDKINAVITDLQATIP